jgi:precorrin-6B methylase 2
MWRWNFNGIFKNNKEIDIRGIEISKNNVQKCVGKGLTVIEGDAEKDLIQFPDVLLIL